MLLLNIVSSKSFAWSSNVSKHIFYIIFIPVYLSFSLTNLSINTLSHSCFQSAIKNKSEDIFFVPISLDFFIVSGVTYTIPLNILDTSLRLNK